MAYNPLIPKSTDQLSLSQGDILANFTHLGAIAGNVNAASGSINTSGTNSGFNWVYLPSNGPAAGNSPPVGSAFPATEVAIYTAFNADTNRKELYINKTVKGPVTPYANALSQIPMTAGQTNDMGILLANRRFNGWSFLPSGMKIAWGYGAILAGGNVTVLYSSLLGFPGFTQMATPQATRLRQATNVPVADFLFINTYDNLGFNIRSSDGLSTVEFTWMAIGL